MLCQSISAGSPHKPAETVNDVTKYVTALHSHTHRAHSVQSSFYPIGESPINNKRHKLLACGDLLTCLAVNLSTK